MSDKFCPQCGRKGPIEKKEVTEEFLVRGESITVSGEVNVCVACKNPLGDRLYDSLMKRAYDVYRSCHGLLSAKEIRAIREGYGLSQSLFARILKIGEATLQRYERGSLPSLALHSLLVGARSREVFRAMVEEARDLLTDEDYQAGLAAVASLPEDQIFEEDPLSQFSEKTQSWISFVQKGEQGLEPFLNPDESLQAVSTVGTSSSWKLEGGSRWAGECPFLKRGVQGSETRKEGQERHYVLAA